MRGFNRQCDVIVTSIHWDGNWGCRIRDEETCFAHQLIEHGIAVVHGHSSHHVKTVEIHSDRLALYGLRRFPERLRKHQRA
jgi:poly-gamma-glutamate capsule biosynthesis protein CapA/YwtB (metallophosphatase superfamily)